MTVSELLKKAFSALLPTWPKLPTEELLSRALAFLLFALLLYALKLVLQKVSEALFRRFGPRARRLLSWFWTLFFLTLLLAGGAAIFQLGRPEAILLVGLKLTFAYLVWLFVEAAIEVYLARRGVDANLVVLARYLALVLVLVWTAYMVAGREIAPLIGALGVAGLAVSLAAQDTFSNFIAGVVLLADRPFRIGDWIRVGDKLGRVEGITLRTTRIRTPDNELIALPNAKVAGDEIQNLSAGGPLRIHVPVGVAYRYDPDEVRPVLEAVLKGHPELLKNPPPEVWVRELADSSVNYALVAWIPEDAIARLPRITAELTEAAKKALDAAGIEIPFPQRTLWFAEPLKIVQESASQSESTKE